MRHSRRPGVLSWRFLAMLLAATVILSASGAMNAIVDSPASAFAASPRAASDTVQLQSPQASAERFTDVKPGTWYYNAVNSLAGKGIISGFPDGSFRPDDTVTAAQLIKLVCSAVNTGAYGATGTIPQEDGAIWSDKWYVYAALHEIIYDTDDFFYQRDTAISRYDTALIVSRAAALIDDNPDSVSSGDSEVREFIKDFDSVPAKYLESVTDTFMLGILLGYEDGSFGGTRNLTRAESAAVVLRLLDMTKRIANPTGESLDPPYAYDPPADTQKLPPAPNSGASFSPAETLFIGDSLTEGFYLSGKISKADFLRKVGIGIHSVASAQLDFNSGKVMTVTEALTAKSYKYIYIMLGTNNLGGNTASFQTSYNNLIELIRKNNPEAAIFIQSIPPVSRDKSEKSTTATRENVLTINKALKKLCENDEIYFVDIYAVLADKNGYLPSDLTTDGIHLEKAAYKLWADYLMG